VEQALAELWREAGAARPGDESRRAVTRAAAWNLVVPCTAATEAAARAAVGQVVAAHPARVLLLVAGDGSREMTASVTALCYRLGSAERQVCCEMIALRARGDCVRHLPDAVRALLAPDLPVAVWWPGGDPGEHGRDVTRGAANPMLLAAPLAPLADRWVVDTGAGENGRALAATASFVPGLRGTVSDLAWMRLLPWRELTAQFFDPPAFRSCLPCLDRLDAWVAPGAGPRAEAFLWLGWVAARLGWQVESPTDSESWRLRRPNGDAAAAVRRDEPTDLPRSSYSTDEQRAALPGELRAVRLASTEREISFTIARHPWSDCATLVVSTEGACPLPRVVRLPGSERARLLAAALGEPRRDPLYPDALAVAARLVQ
jgi:glucose-6-phosphate dehydrogenase assembly protein OpcA